ncbi:MAG TPA: hypothetical protein VK745_26875 [Polyangiaceae bacterium]|nr:hypothetical protein [Polyangiaceae bacterium]
MFQSSVARVALALGCLSPLLGCATGSQAALNSDDDTTDLGGSSTGGATTSGGASGGSSSTAAGAVGSSGHPGTAGSTGTAGSSSTGTAGSSTSTGGATGTAGSTSSGGTHAGGSGGASSSAGATSAGGSTSGAGASSGGASSAGATGSAGAVGSAGATGSGTTLFSDDFESGNASNWATTGGTWAIAMDGSNVYEETALSASTLVVSAHAATWTGDQTVTARVKVDMFTTGSSSYVAEILARYSASGYYALALREDGKVSIRKGTSTLNNPADASIVAGTWYTLKFQIVGTTLNAYVNNTLWVTFTDSTYTSGGVALAVENTTAEFDDVVVTSP